MLMYGAATTREIPSASPDTTTELMGTLFSGSLLTSNPRAALNPPELSNEPPSNKLIGFPPSAATGSCAAVRTWRA